MRKYLDQPSTERLVHAFVTSRLDCNNSLLYGLPANQLQPLQRIQNTAARLITRSKRNDHITPILCKLHWLPVSKRIIFKTLLLTFKAHNGLAPSYISDLIAPIKCSSIVSLRSSEKNLLQPGPRNKTDFYGDRAFSVAAPKLWNALPQEIRSATSLSMFKSKLKTHLFTL